MQCATEYALNAYLAEQERAEKRQEWVEQEAAQKYIRMQPLLDGQILEALSEMNGTTSQCIAQAFAKGDVYFGALLRAEVASYWMNYCTRQAQDEADEIKGM